MVDIIDAIHDLFFSSLHYNCITAALFLSFSKAIIYFIKLIYNSLTPNKLPICLKTCLKKATVKMGNCKR